MPHLPAAHCVKVGLTFKHLVEAVTGENTFVFQDVTDNVFSDFPGFATQVFAAAVAQLVPHQWSNCLWTGVVLEDIRSIPYGGSDYPKTPTAGSKGAGTGNIPTASSFCVSKLTGTFGRSYRGRWYWPLWNISDLSTADTITTVRADEIKNALTAFQAAVEVGTYPGKVGIVSQQTGGVTRPAGLFYQINSWAYFDTRVDNQRRRLLGRGP